MNKMRILHIVSDLDRGGVEKQMVEVIRALPNLDHHIFSLLGDGPLFSEIENTNITFATQKNPLKFLREIRSLIKEIRPNVIQTWMFHSDLFGGLAAMGTGSPVVWSYHASKLERRSLKLTTYVVIRTLGILSHVVPKLVIACSDSSHNAALENSYVKRKLNIIPNGIDSKHYSLKNKDFEELERIVVFPARWHVHKGHKVLLEAWKLIKQNGVSGKLLLMGQEVDEKNSELNDLIHQYGLEGSVKTLGEISDVRAVYWNADIVVISSLTEAMPLALCEAMSCGLVPVVTDVGDMKNMVNKVGVVCEAGNAASLAEALAHVMAADQSEMKSLSLAARDRVIQEYDIGATALAYERTWSEIAHLFPIDT
jgi:glycosyltransferase involved in cell wall biosynthesis